MKVQKGVNLYFLTSEIYKISGQRHGPIALPPGEQLAHILEEGVWAPLWVWRDAGNLVYTEIGSTNRPKLKTV
jgi:hypothetical protein